MSTLFFVTLKFIGERPVQKQIRILAYWNLWLGTGFAIVAAIAGWFAYNSVAHDTASHAAMTEHRNWALLTLSIFVAISFYSIQPYKSAKKTGLVFITVMLLAFVLLTTTAWHGGEAVYRYGLGVMSLPVVDGEGHAHEHTEGEGHTELENMPKNEASDKSLHEHDNLEVHQDKKTFKVEEHNHSEHSH